MEGGKRREWGERNEGRVESVDDSQENREGRVEGRESRGKRD